MAPKKRSAAAATVEKAVRFIEERIGYHSTETSVKIGAHLFEHVYGGRRELFKKGGDAWTRDCIGRIASDARVDVDDDVLYMCIHCHLLVTEHRRTAPELPLPPISSWKWERLWCLEKDPASLVEVASWVATENVPHDLIDAAARLVRPYLDEGGDLHDLLIRPHKRPADTIPRRIDRILGVVERKVEEKGVTAGARARVLAVLDEMIASLAGDPREGPAKRPRRKR